MVYAERLIDLHDEAIRAVRGPGLRGTVRLGVSESIVHKWLPALLARVSAAHPGLGLEIDVNISPWLRERLLTRDLDLAFLVGPVDHPNLSSRRLCSLPMAFLASDRITFARDPVGLEEVVTRPLITFGRYSKPRSDLRELVTPREGMRATIHASASLEVVVRFGLEGGAVAVIPPPSSRAGPECEPAPPEYRDRSSEPRILRVPAGRRRPPAVAKVTEIAVAVAAGL